MENDGGAVSLDAVAESRAQHAPKEPSAKAELQRDEHIQQSAIAADVKEVAAIDGMLKKKEAKELETKHAKLVARNKELKQEKARYGPKRVGYYPAPKKTNAHQAAHKTNAKPKQKIKRKAKGTPKKAKVAPKKKKNKQHTKYQFSKAAIAKAKKSSRKQRDMGEPRDVNKKAYAEATRAKAAMRQVRSEAELILKQAKMQTKALGMKLTPKKQPKPVSKAAAAKQAEAFAAAKPELGEANDAQAQWVQTVGKYAGPLSKKAMDAEKEAIVKAWKGKNPAQLVQELDVFSQKVKKLKMEKWRETHKQREMHLKFMAKKREKIRRLKRMRAKRKKKRASNLNASYLASVGKKREIAGAAKKYTHTAAKMAAKLQKLRQVEKPTKPAAKKPKWQKAAKKPQKAKKATKHEKKKAVKGKTAKKEKKAKKTTKGSKGAKRKQGKPKVLAPIEDSRPPPSELAAAMSMYGPGGTKCKDCF